MEKALEPSVSRLLQEATAKTGLEAKEIYLRTYLEKDKREAVDLRRGTLRPCFSSDIYGKGGKQKDSGMRSITSLSQPTGRWCEEFL